MNPIEQELSRLSEYLVPNGEPNAKRINNYTDILLRSDSALTVYDLEVWAYLLEHIEIIDATKHQSICEYVMKRGLASLNFKEWGVLSKLIDKFDIGTIHKAIPAVDIKRNPWARWWFLHENNIESKVPEYDWFAIARVGFDIHNGDMFFKKVLDVCPEHKDPILFGVYEAGFHKIMGSNWSYQAEGLGSYIFEVCKAYPKSDDVQKQLITNVNDLIKTKKEAQLVSLMYSLKDLLKDKNTTQEYYDFAIPIIDAIATAAIKQLIIVCKESKLPNLSKQAVKGIDTFLSGLQKYQQATNTKVKDLFKKTLTVCVTPDVMRPGSGVLTTQFDMDREMYWKAFDTIAPSVLVNNLKYYIAGGDYATYSKFELTQHRAWSHDEFFSGSELNIKSLILLTNEYRNEPNLFENIANIICDPTKESKFNVSSIHKLSKLVIQEDTWDWPLWDNPKIKDSLLVSFVHESSREYGWTSDVIYAPNPNHPVLKFLEYKYGVTDLEDILIEECALNGSKPNHVLTNIIGRVLLEDPEFDIKKFIELDALFNDGKGNTAARIHLLLKQDTHAKQVVEHALPELGVDITNRM